MKMFPDRRRRAFHVLIIRPSKYDDEGYVIRYARGVLPSNTLGVLSALTRQAFDSGRFSPDVETETSILDDTVQDINVKRLARKHLGPGRCAVVAFAGVQSNQFPRASDLAVRFKQAGFEVMIGGFHVSGAIVMSPQMPAECRALMDQGVTLVKGEVENAWADLLEDAWEGRLQLFYDIIEKPDIADAPVPLVDPRYQKHFLYPYMATIDAGRGCPFNCSFCTIINVQGRKMRCRSAASIMRQVEENHRRHRIAFYFFTDDNFARNRNWEAIFDGLIALREENNIPMLFMMQIDTQAWKIPRFVEKAARAGCTQVFLGVESLNPENLKAASKNQNTVGEMAQMVQAWHEAGCACHAGYIIGFPFDSHESVMRDVENLQSILFDQCSFFMLTPLPGSADHARMTGEAAYMDPDLNHYDSCHETLRLPRFKEGEWRQTHTDAWHAFYTFDYMRNVLKRANAHTYWGTFKNYMWYRSALLEKMHPMVAGFWRLKPRTDRQPGFRPEGRWKHFLRRARESVQTLKTYGGLFLELQDLWLQTRIRPEPVPGYFSKLRDEWGEHLSQWSESLGTRATEMRRGIEERSANAREWIHDSAADFSRRFRTCFEDFYAARSLQGNGLLLWAKKILVRLNSRGKRRFITSRAHLNSYWRQLCGWIREGRLVRLAFETPRIVVNAFREARLWVTFTIYFIHELTCP